MYTYEIQELLKIKQYLIDNETYIDIINTSPQIDHVHYEPYDDYFEIWSNDGLHEKFKVYIKNRNK